MACLPLETLSSEPGNLPSVSSGTKRLLVDEEGWDWMEQQEGCDLHSSESLVLMNDLEWRISL